MQKVHVCSCKSLSMQKVHVCSCKSLSMQKVHVCSCKSLSMQKVHSLQLQESVASQSSCLQQQESVVARSACLQLHKSQGWKLSQHFPQIVFKAWNVHIMYIEKTRAAATAEYRSEPSGSHSCEMLGRGRCSSRDSHSTEGWFASDSSMCGACPTL